MVGDKRECLGYNKAPINHLYPGRDPRKFVPNATSTTSTQTIQKHKRPLSATILTWVVLILASLGWLRFFNVLQQWSFLTNLTPAPPVLYLAVTGLTWGVLGAFLVWGLFLGCPWALRLMQVSAILYAAAYWIDRLLLADPSAITSRWPFALSLTVFLLVYTFWVLSRTKAKRFYQYPES